MREEQKELEAFRVELIEQISRANTIAISGHVRPDGDCTGSTLGMYHFIQKNLNEKKEKQVDLFLEFLPQSFEYLLCGANINTEYNGDVEYDLFISLDCASIDRLGFSEVVMKKAKQTINIDHHISNPKFAAINYVEAESSSTCEILAAMIKEDELNLSIANALYTGIVHDTGVFKHSNTSRRTMEMAGKMIDQGVNTSSIIDGSFYQKTYVQNQILGRCLLESLLVLDGKCIVSYVMKKQMDFYQADSYDLEGIVDQLRVTKGVEVAILIQELEQGKYKVSMRSNQHVDVSAIATFFGGGGHVRAAGCTMKGSVHDVINNITLHIENQLNQLS